MYSTTAFQYNFALNSTYANSTVKKQSGFLTFFHLKAAYCSIGTLGFLWNAFVVVVLLRFGRRQVNLNTSSSMFHICWQACVDATVALLLLTTSLIDDASKPVFARNNFWHEFFCRVWLSKVVLWAALTASTFSVLALNFERYVAVVHPIFHKVKFSRTRKYSAFLLFGILCFSVVHKFSSAIVASGIASNKRCRIFSYWPSEAYERFVGASSVVLEYFVPLGLIVLLYFRMALKLHHKIAPEKSLAESTISTVADPHSEGGTNSTRAEMEGSGSRQAREMIRARNNVLKTSALLSLAFVVCWSPNQVYYTMYQFGVATLGTAFYHVSVLMVFLNCCLNPAIYCLKYRPFQQSCAGVVLRWRSMFK